MLNRMWKYNETACFAICVNILVAGYSCLRVPECQIQQAILGLSLSSRTPVDIARHACVSNLVFQPTALILHDGCCCRRPNEGATLVADMRPSSVSGAELQQLQTCTQALLAIA